MSFGPTHCRSESFHAMCAAAPRIETIEGLRDAALAIARHADPESDLDMVRVTLGEWTAAIAARIRGDDPRAIAAHAHEYLFGEIGLQGDSEQYDAPRNCLLHRVVERRRGMPILLSLVYKLVVEPLGLRVHGVGAPGHFMLQLEGDEPFRTMIVDPFAQGRVLTVPEGVDMVRSIVGDDPRWLRDPLPLVSHREWISRILRNLKRSYEARERPEDEAAMIELAKALELED